ncbi:hypothetical protein F4820DRAFT_445950 [Hypoxylon rubiginosum]|uniref:Uncharacterized protein n=1 Tax=Hypoxylon rubiginosum TaxID=110542 RepID=A0ACB9Z718_9PEZI|nr:hypothetical protein F4820DRAFT_445950 [Hypoxylon rubiginosum]
MFSTNALSQTVHRTQQQMPFRRAYSDKRPPLSHGGNNRTVIIALVAVAIPALAWFSMRTTKPVTSTNVPSPTLNPAERSRTKRENERDTPQALHAEQEDPELKAPFGALHKAKRVDGPPDGRNHQALSDRRKERAQSADSNH